MTPRRPAGPRARPPGPRLRAPGRRVRPRRGRAAVGRRGQRVPRLPDRPGRQQPRALPPGRRRGDPRAGRAPHPRRQPLLHRAGAAPGPAPGRVLAGRQGALRQLRHRGQRGGAQGRAQGQAAGRRIVVRAPRLPRAHVRLAVGHAAGVQAGALRAARAGLRRGRADRRGDHGGRRRRGPPPSLLEPVQGESGVYELGEDVLRAARAACDAHGAALIFDEVQCGLGRTGTLWAYQHSGVVPDALTVAKALGGGLPIGALVTGERLADVFAPGDHGSTFAGGPVQCAAGLAVLDVIDDEDLLGARARAGRAPAPRAGRAARRRRGPRPRADARLRARPRLPARRRGHRRARAARAAAGAQRDRPDHRPPAAAADHRRGAGRRRASAACAPSFTDGAG